MCLMHQHKRARTMFPVSRLLCDRIGRRRQARDHALSEATQVAVSKAKVIAQALGGRVVRIVEVQEEGFQQRPPVPFYAGELSMAKATAATPIEVGSLDVTSKVQLIAEVEM